MLRMIAGLILILAVLFAFVIPVKTHLRCTAGSSAKTVFHILKGESGDYNSAASAENQSCDAGQVLKLYL